MRAVRLAGELALNAVNQRVNGVVVLVPSLIDHDDGVITARLVRTAEKRLLFAVILAAFAHLVGRRLLKIKRREHAFSFAAAHGDAFNHPARRLVLPNVLNCRINQKPVSAHAVNDDAFSGDDFFLLLQGLQGDFKLALLCLQVAALRVVFHRCGQRLDTGDVVLCVFNPISNDRVCSHVALILHLHQTEGAGKRRLDGRLCLLLELGVFQHRLRDTRHGVREQL